jgi:hypothetical protein
VLEKILNAPFNGRRNLQIRGNFKERDKHEPPLRDSGMGNRKRWPVDGEFVENKNVYIEGPGLPASFCPSLASPGGFDIQTKREERIGTPTRFHQADGIQIVRLAIPRIQNMRVRFIHTRRAKDARRLIAGKRFDGEFDVAETVADVRTEPERRDVASF